LRWQGHPQLATASCEDEVVGSTQLFVG